MTGQIFHVIGDLVESGEQYIAHGCNTHDVIGGGVSGPIVRKWPEVELAYHAACKSRQFFVGTCQVVKTTDGHVVFNIASQEAPGADGSYWAVMLAMGNLIEFCIKHGIRRVAIPRIGCGIAGLRWPQVEFIINGIFQWRPNAPEIWVYTHPSEAHLPWD